MSMQDTLADMLTRIRNALAVHKATVSCPHTKLKENVLTVLRDQGYIKGYTAKQEENRPHKQLIIELKYFENRSVISRIDRKSRPSLRVYKDSTNMPEVKDGLGIAIVSTSKGVMTGRQAKEQKLGGEVICCVE